MTAALMDSDERSASNAEPPARVPAWKKLGLKLKFASEHTDQPTQLENKKRPRDESSLNLLEATGSEHGLRKRPRPDPPRPRSTKSNATNVKLLPPSLRRDSNGVKKTVSFTTDTKAEDGDSSKTLIADWEAQYDQPSSSSSLLKDPEPSKKKAPKSKKSKLRPTTKKTPTALEYLTEFCESRRTWKFRKNKEVWILKHLFSIDEIPSGYDISLSQYLQGLKSASTRSRIEEEAEEIIEKDREQQLDYTISIDSDGGGGKVDELPADMEDPARRRAYYEDSVRRYKRRLERHLDEAAEEELNWVSPERLAKRRRAEITLWAIGVAPSSKETAQSSEATISAPSASRNGSSTQETETPKTSLPKKRKNRTSVIDLSSSSSSSEDESSDSSGDSDGDAKGDEESDSQGRSTGSTTGTQSTTPTQSQQEGSVNEDTGTSTTTSTSSSESSDDESALNTEGAAIVTRRCSKSIISISS